MTSAIQPDGIERAPLEKIAQQVGTPYYIYDAALLRERVAGARTAITNRGVQLRFAMKACSAHKVLETMRESGIWIDAVSANEALRARRAGFAGGHRPPQILYTADVFRDGAVAVIQREGLLPNIGSPLMVEALAHGGWNGPIGLRVNPGFGHGHVQACDTGGPSSKHGIWPDQEAAVRADAAHHGFPVVLLHAHIGTGSGVDEFVANMTRLTEFFLERLERYPQLEAVSFGGGIPYPYRPGTTAVDLDPIGVLLARARKEIERRAGRSIRVEIEPGRYFVAPVATLVARVTDIKRTQANEKGAGQTFVMVDAGFVDLVRPAMYGSYHHISVAGKRTSTHGAMNAVVAGPLCESGDVFTRDAQELVDPRELPTVTPGDLVLLHDAGAYGASMSSNYNSIGRAPQVWWDGGRTALMSRRETLDDIVRAECWEELR